LSDPDIRGLAPGTQEFKLPVPDPTTLTTDQLRREIAALKEVLQTQLAALADRVTLMQEHLDRRSADISKEVAHLRTLHDEKFVKVATQFHERDTRTEQRTHDNKISVDAALQTTTKQIDQIGVILDTTARGLSDKIDDIKTRVTQVETRTEGLISSWANVTGKVESVATRMTQIEGQKKGGGDVFGAALGLVGVLISVGTFISLLLTRR